MATDLRSAVAETWDRALDAERSVSVPAVVARVMSDYPALVAVESQRLAREAITRWVKGLARTESESGSQLTLAGFPAVIAVPTGPDEDEEGDPGYRYMRTTKATWADLDAGRGVRVANVTRAQARLDAYDTGLERVRPFMEGTDRTLAEALGQA